MAGIMHFSNFFRYMESAEHAFLRSRGLSVDLKGFGPGLCLPRVHAECDYLAPLRFEDEVEIRLRVARKTRRSLEYEFRFQRRNTQVPKDVARGRVTVVCALRRPDGTFKSTDLPPAIADRIQVAPRALLNSGSTA